MKVLILEDELPAQMQLKRLLKTYFPQYEVVAALDAVESAVNWLEDNQPDLILMDVELADGICFELFSRIEVKASQPQAAKAGIYNSRNGSNPP